MREKLLGFDVDYERQSKKLRSAQTDTKEARKSNVKRKKRRRREKTLRG